MVAGRFGMDYLDTGKLYRAVGKKLIEAGEDLSEAERHDSEAAAQAIEIASKFTIIDIETAGELATEEVGQAASIVSAIPGVRQALLDFQREVARSPRGAVLDGRDIGTVVCPEADLKFFITASLEARADRRYKELQKHDDSIIRQAVFQDLERRDARDTQRRAAPLKQAEDAIYIDTTEMDIETVFQKVCSTILSFAPENK